MQNEQEGDPTLPCCLEYRCSDLFTVYSHFFLFVDSLAFRSSECIMFHLVEISQLLLTEY